jgi:hypothetical protein
MVPLLREATEELLILASHGHCLSIVSTEGTYEPLSSSVLELELALQCTSRQPGGP